MSAILNSLLDKPEEPSLHCISSINGDDTTELPTFTRLDHDRITWLKVQ